MLKVNITQVANGYTLEAFFSNGNGGDWGDDEETETLVATSPQQVIQLLAAKIGCPLNTLEI